jgi:DNA-binding beta-propeller fold protein YncE
MKAFAAAIAFVACAVLNYSSAESRPAGGYHIIDSLQLGGDGGWDYLTVDTSAERLYVSRGTRVQVIDLSSHRIVGEIPNTIGVHGITFAPSLGRGYTSNGRDSSVTVFDLKTLTTITTIKINGRNPDAILFEPSSGRVFTFNGGSKDATAIDVGSNAVVGTIPLDGKPEFAVSDGQGHIYVNIEDKSELAMLDPASLKVLKRWSIAPGEEPSGLAIDRKHRKLFSACGNRLMIVSDADSGIVVGKVTIGGGVDGAAFNPLEKLAFSSNGEGTLTVVQEGSEGKFAVVEDVVTRRGARTLVFDEKTQRIYTVTARFGPPPAPTAERPHPRPSIEPGSVTLYTISR